MLKCMWTSSNRANREVQADRVMYSGHAGIYNAHINGHNKHSTGKKTIKNSNI